METVIVAFEGEKTCHRIREILENAGAASCLLCHSAAEVKRLVHKQHISTVISGFKFPDDSAEGLFEDLPPSCAMLLLAVQSQLDLCGNEDIFKLASPVSKGDLIASVRMLIQMSHRLERFVRTSRSTADQREIEKAKRALMERFGITEEDAHRQIQRRSMDSGRRLAQTARQVLAELERKKDS